jgi:hypothetical protein
VNETAVALASFVCRFAYAVGDVAIKRALDIKKADDSGAVVFRTFDSYGRPSAEGAGSQRADFSRNLYGKLAARAEGGFANASLVRFIAAEAIPPIVPIFPPTSYASPLVRFALLLSTHLRALFIFSVEAEGMHTSVSECQLVALMCRAAPCMAQCRPLRCTAWRRVADGAQK